MDACCRRVPRQGVWLVGGQQRTLTAHVHIVALWGRGRAFLHQRFSCKDVPDEQEPGAEGERCIILILAAGNVSVNVSGSESWTLCCDGMCRNPGGVRSDCCLVMRSGCDDRRDESVRGKRKRGGEDPRALRRSCCEGAAVTLVRG